MILKSPRLETFVSRNLAIWSAIIIGLVNALLFVQASSIWLHLILSLVMLLICIFVTQHFKKILSSMFQRAILQIEAIQAEDYSQYAKPIFDQGVVNDFHRKLDELSEELYDQKSRYDQQVFIVYRLIDQLESPILVFDKNDRLVYANGAFATLYNQPWQMFRHAAAQKLDLNHDENAWVYKNNQHKWEIKHSTFVDKGEVHELLVFVDISSTLRENQLNAWQQIIRVLGHEIRNTLTPISTIAENLAEKNTDERDKKALSLITERCQHMQDFVGRYSVLTQSPRLNCQTIVIAPFLERIEGLFNELDVECSTEVANFWGDVAFIEQVFINLIKNAREANASKITIHFKREKSSTVISLVDNGHGFQNLTNLFVPLYSTKEQGQGIGLSFCQSVIEQHSGHIQLENNPDKGVNVVITLPNQPFNSSI